MAKEESLFIVWLHYAHQIYLFYFRRLSSWKYRIDGKHTQTHIHAITQTDICHKAHVTTKHIHSTMDKSMCSKIYEKITTVAVTDEIGMWPYTDRIWPKGTLCLRRNEIIFVVCQENCLNKRIIFNQTNASE